MSTSPKAAPRASSPSTPSPKSAARVAGSSSSSRTKSDEVKQYAQKASKKPQGMSETTMVMIGFGALGLILALLFMFKAPETASSGVDSRTLLLQGIALTTGEGVAKDEAKGLELLKKAASMGHPEAQHRLGYLYTYGTEGIETDPALGASYYLMASKQGIPDSMVNYGLALANGAGVEQNMDEAFKWWKKASNKGNPIATGNVGRCHEAGIGTEINLDKAAEFYKKGILLDDAGSMFHMSNMYMKGINQVKDIEKGLALLKQAADKEFSTALSTLGEIYFKGTHYPRDPAAAMHLLSKAAQRRDVKASYLIGLAYLSNEGANEGTTVQPGEQNIYGVTHNPQAAYQTIRSAAQQGSADAAYQMATMLEQGVGIEADSTEAYNWLLNAAKGGSGEAAMELLSKNGTPAYGGQISLDEEEEESMIKTALRSEDKEVKGAALKLWGEFNAKKAGDAQEEKEEEFEEVVPIETLE